MNDDNVHQQDDAIQTPPSKFCDGCKTLKDKTEFCRPKGNNLQVHYEFATCNNCATRLKNKRKGKNETKSKTENIIPILPHSTSNFTNFENFKLLSDESNFMLEELPDTLSNKNDDDDLEENEDITLTLLYELDEVHQIVSKEFEEERISNEPVKFSFEIELDSAFSEILQLDQQSTTDLKAFEKRFQEVAEILIVPIEAGSGYYWETRKIYLNTKKKELTGHAVVYLGCTQRSDRAFQRPEDQEIKRRSESRIPISRYECSGSIKLYIHPDEKRVIVQVDHKVAHQHPDYKRIEFPIKAKEWIKNNIALNMKNAEVYQRLTRETIIDPKIHTKEQVYYWTSVYKKEIYMMNKENQLLSAKKFLEQSDFKILCYLENEFVRAMGFLTSLIKHVNLESITEIVVDSTFKTNQERFELFAVNANCGGYGMPIAYLYLCTYNGNKETWNQNGIKTRVEVLKMFFSSLREEGMKPIFVLVDKDAGEISAVNDAWSRITNIQLCYWHLERAISRKLKEKKPKSGTYTETKALEVHRLFDFIDQSWIPINDTDILCPDESIKELLNMIKKHANMHSLIPLAKGNFLTSTEIYQFCVRELYEFCYSQNLRRLWGYLWMNWYNNKDWNLFARSSYSAALPLARTTMITESHWRVLKYNYKYNYNRPRLDQLTYILVENLIPDFEIKLIQYNDNRTFPAWWKSFKKEWIKLSTTDIAPDIDERYHIDVNNWICSCPAYLNSRYLLCKHLVSKKNGNEFLPTFLKTARRHDYPLLTFDNDKLPPIALENNPWSRYQIMEEISTSSTNCQDIIMTTEPTENIFADRREYLAKLKTKFNSALKLYEQEIDNDNFVRNFEALMEPVIKEIDECEKALQARNQQNTWQRKSGKLAFYLH